MASLKSVLLACYDEAFDRKAWHGANVMQTLHDLTLEQLTFRSPYEGYCAWQVVLHMAYWKWDARKRISFPERVARFARSPRDWPKLPAALDADAWRADLELLLSEHRLLRELIERLPASRLSGTVPPRDYPIHRYVYAVAAHDVYHTAQIRNMGIPGLR